MNKRYTYSDPIFRDNTKYPNIRIELGKPNPILNVFRLISGTINCNDAFTNSIYKFRTDLIQLPYIKNFKTIQKTINDIFPDEVSLADIDRYFKKTRSNKKFYESVETEILKSKIAYKENRFLESFFFLYRVLEGISYSLPLLYVSKSRDYNKSFDKLKSFFNSKNEGGELAFFKLFITTTYKEEDFFKSTIDVDLNEIGIEDLKEPYYKLYIERIKPDAIKDSTENEQIKISFIGFYEFILEIRNRYFHYRQGTWRKNLKSTEILYPDLFFKPLVKHGLNWVSIIIFEIIKNDIQLSE